jgi:hypothetical protein
MKVIVKKVGETPILMDIPDTLKAIRRIIGCRTVQVVGSRVCTGNFLVDEDGAINGTPYNCSAEGHKFYGTIIYAGPITRDFNDADKEALKRFNAQAVYGNLGKERWVWC